MLKHEVNLGELIIGPALRDAVHVAVAPVVAGQELAPGEHVGLEAGQAKTMPRTVCIGIVDPYLTKTVVRGATFWLMLYPGSITSLRHDWCHEAFSDSYLTPPTAEQIAESEQWIKDFAYSMNMDYHKLMDAASDYAEFGTYVYDNSERYKDQWSQFPLFWRHFQLVTGGKGMDCSDDVPFTCSC